MNKICGISMSLASLCLPQLSMAENDFEKFGDIMQYALPAAALAGTYVADDKEGRKQFAYSFATALGTTSILKGAYGKLRPNSNSKTSFPSGHTTAAFQGAGFIDIRYGHKWGVPAYVLATLTGISRVDSDNHFVDDVLAGASIGLFSNWYWVTPYKSNVSISPMTDGDSIGVSLNISNERGGPKQARSEKGSRVARYTLGIGSAALQENRVASPGDGGTTFDLESFEKIDDPTTSAIGTLEWFLNARSTVIFSLSPFESRDKGEFTTPVNFAGSTFPSDTEIRSSWLMYDLSATYAYSLTPDSRFKTQIGAGLSYQHTRTELQMADTKVSARVTDDSLIPFLYGALDLELTDKWLLTSQVGGSQLSSDSYLFGDIGVLYRLDDHWDLGLGVGYYNREIDTGGLDNNIEYHLAYLSLSYSFY